MEKEYIERELAEKTIDRFEGYLDDDMIFRIKYALRKHIPAADVTPVKHGHWETISESDMNKTVMCSVCDKMFYFTKIWQLNIDMMPYCPNCGAKMDGGEQE